MLPDGVDPTDPGSIPGDPQPGTDTEAEKLLRMAVRFYGAQRCGDGANYLLTADPHGNTCHMQDGHALGGADMTGGWHDAGDYIKFSLTTSWASYALLKVFEVYPDAFDDQYGARHESTPNGVPDVLDQAKYAVDYLVKIHPQEDKLIARIGGDQDHSTWMSSPEQSKRDVAGGGGARPVDPFGEAGADVAGLSSASLSLMSRLWKARDAERAALYLTHAKEIYAYGETHLKGTADGYYPSESYTDDMLCGAVELYKATGEQKYLTDAVRWDDETSQHYWAPDWSNPTDFCRHSLAQLGTDDTLNYWKGDVGNYLSSISTRQYVDGLMVIEGCDWGALACSSGAGTSAAFLYDLLGTPSYLEFANQQLDYILGDNEYGVTFAVGYDDGAPKRPHHRNSAVLGVPLQGALVGGPTPDVAMSEPGDSFQWSWPAGYQDNQDDFVHNEVAIDYNTGLVGLAAFRVALERRQ
jgi:endoglucanase